MILSEHDLELFGNELIQELNDITFNRIYNFLRENPKMRSSINPAFPFPRQINVGIINNCLVVEYVGPEIEDANDFNIKLEYQPSKNLYDFIGIDIEQYKDRLFPFNDSISNTNFFLGNSITYLCDYFYDFMEVHEDHVLNGLFDLQNVNKPVVINNCTYFYTDTSDTLKIRHIDLMEIFPFVDGNVVYHDKASLVYFSEYIIRSTFPTYDIKLHKILNDFIQLINLPETLEPQITKFVEDNPELLQLAFGFNKLNPQKDLIWQDRTGFNNLKPDFLPEDMSGFCNIMDFKLPKLKSKPVVGRENRHHPSYEIDECIAQLDTYEDYCSQHVHQEWILNKYGIKINAPRKFIVMGHSSEFSSEDRQKIRKTRNTTFFTYDEFIEMARFQLYRVK